MGIGGRLKEAHARGWLQGKAESRHVKRASLVYQDFEYLHDVLVEIRKRRGHPPSDLKEQIKLKG